MGLDEHAAHLGDLLDQERRQRLEARMLPTEGPLNPEQRKAVRASVFNYIQRYGIKYRDIARQIGGVTGTVINQVVNDTYKKVSDETLDGHLRGLNEWMEVDARRRVTKPAAKFVETRVALRLLTAAQKASDMCTMALAHGPTGIGKTMCAHVVAERFPGSIYLRISAGNASYMKVRMMLAQRLRFYARRKRRTDSAGLTMDERIFDRLRDSHRLLIVDEAHRIGDSALEFLRDVYDECRVPILFLCTRDLLNRVRRDADADHGQLYSRVGYVCDLTAGADTMPGGNNPLFSLGEIRKLYASDLVKLTSGAVAYLGDVANTLGQGSLRRCGDILRWAILIERAVHKLGPKQAITLTERVLHKAETEPRQDRSMLDDMAHRPVPAVAASA